MIMYNESTVADPITPSEPTLTLERLRQIDYAQLEARVVAALVPGQTDFGAQGYDVEYDSAGKVRFYGKGIELTPDEFEDAIQNDTDLAPAQVDVLQNHVDCITGKAPDPGMAGVPSGSIADWHKAYGGGTVTGRNPDAKRRATLDALKHWLSDDTKTPGPGDPPVITGVDFALDNGSDTPVDHGAELIRENLVDRRQAQSPTVKRFLKEFGNG